jgi:glycerol uptake facilitator-like aquaporin
VTIACALSDTFARIAPRDVPGFLMAELLGALAAAYFFHWLSEGTVMLSKAKKVDYTGWDKVAEPTLSLVHSTANVMSALGH